MRDFVRKPFNWIKVAIVLSVLGALIISFFGSINSNLPSYNSPNTNVGPVKDTPEEVKIETQEYISEDYGFSMPVPKEWTYVLKNGCDSYINNQDGSIFMIATNEYDPTMNAVTQDTASNDVTNAGGVLNDYIALSNSSYAVAYEIGSLDYLELNTWDLDTFVRVSIQIPAQKYTDYADDMISLLDNFTWTKPNPIPEGFSMYYSEYGNFEFPIPDNWQYGIEDGAFVAADNESGSNYRVSASSTTYDTSALTQLDYINAMSSVKSGYMITNFQNSGSLLSATATFNNENTTYQEIHFIMSTGTYQYELLIQAPLDYYEANTDCFDTISKYFRVF